MLASFPHHREEKVLSLDHRRTDAAGMMFRKKNQAICRYRVASENILTAASRCSFRRIREYLVELLYFAMGPLLCCRGRVRFNCEFVSDPLDGQTQFSVDTGCKGVIFSQQAEE